MILKNEVVTDEMIGILSELQKYVPKHTTTKACEHPSRPEEIQYHRDVFHQLLFGGDQLTLERIRSAQMARSNSNREEDKLQGFLPVIEDWHAEVILLSVSIILDIRDHV